MSKSAVKIQRAGPGRLSAEQTEELPDRLMDAAFELFIERGFADATMDDIAKRAGASTKTLYSRFANKMEILQAVVERNVERTVLAHVRNFALAPETSTPRDYLYKLGLQVAIGTGNPGSGLQRVSLAEAHRFPQLRKNFQGVIGRGVDAVANALRVWRDKGLISFEEDAHIVATVVFSALTDVPRTRSVIGLPMSRAEAERHVGTAVDLILKGMQPAKAQRTKPKGQTQ
jgi:TetR/AcrR family transcriptional repressor of mexJK operon